MPEPLEPSPANVMVHVAPVVSDITPTVFCMSELGSTAAIKSVGVWA